MNGMSDASLWLGIVLASIAGLGAFFTLRGDVAALKVRLGDAERRNDVLTTRLEKGERDLQDFRILVAEGYVRNAVMREVRDQLVTEIKEVEHSVSNRFTRALGELIPRIVAEVRSQDGHHPRRLGAST